MTDAVADSGKINRFGWGVAAVAACAGAAVLAGAPWLFAKLLPATGTAFAYDPNFVATGGPIVLGLWASSALVYGAVFAAGEWRPFTRRLDAAMTLVWIVAMTWLVAGPQIFASEGTDQAAKFWLGVLLFIVVLSTIPKVRR